MEKKQRKKLNGNALKYLKRAATKRKTKPVTLGDINEFLESKGWSNRKVRLAIGMLQMKNAPSELYELLAPNTDGDRRAEVEPLVNRWMTGLARDSCRAALVIAS